MADQNAKPVRKIEGQKTLLGRTMHGIAYVEIHEFSGVTDDNDWLVLTLDPRLDDVRFIRVQTVSSPSWVAWKEIQAYGNQ